jgi:hypothetical protein
MDLRKLKKTNKKNFEKHVQNLLDYVKQFKDEKDTMKFVCECFDEMLDRMADEDFFGTEQQNDPRGDPR